MKKVVIAYKGFEIKSTGTPEFKYKVIGAAIYEPGNTKYCFGKNLSECKEYIDNWLNNFNLLNWYTVKSGINNARKFIVHA